MPGTATLKSMASPPQRACRLTNRFAGPWNFYNSRPEPAVRVAAPLGKGQTLFATALPVGDLYDTLGRDAVRIRAQQDPLVLGWCDLGEIKDNGEIRALS